MNILQVNMSLDPVTGGGTVERVRQLHMAMREIEGVSPRILSLKVGCVRDVEDDADVILLPCLSSRWYLPMPRLITIWQQIQWADAVILMNHWTVLNAIVYWMLRMSGKPYLVCPAGALPMFGRSQLFKRLYNIVVGRALIAGADAAIAIAKDEAVDMQRYGVDVGRIHHIPNGVCSTDFSCTDASLFRRHIGLRETDDYLLFVGRLNQIKGPDLLLEAFTKVATDYPGLHLAFVGPDGGLLAELENRANQSGLAGRVHFAGYAGGDLKSSAMHGASILVVPSRQEAMSIVALEAAVCSTPVIMTERCGFDALAAAGGAILVEANEERIADAIRELMGDNALRDRMGKSGRELARNEYSWSIAAQRHCELVRNVVGKAVI